MVTAGYSGTAVDPVSRATRRCRSVIFWGCCLVRQLVLHGDSRARRVSPGVVAEFDSNMDSLQWSDTCLDHVTRAGIPCHLGAVRVRPTAPFARPMGARDPRSGSEVKIVLDVPCRSTGRQMKVLEAS